MSISTWNSVSIASLFVATQDFEQSVCPCLCSHSGGTALPCYREVLWRIGRHRQRMKRHLLSCSEREHNNKSSFYWYKILAKTQSQLPNHNSSSLHHNSLSLSFSFCFFFECSFWIQVLWKCWHSRVPVFVCPALSIKVLNHCSFKAGLD